MPSPFQRIADRAATTATRCPRATLAVAVTLAAIGAWLGAVHLPLDADTNALIAPERPFMVAYREFLNRCGDLEEAIVVVDPCAHDAATPAEGATGDSSITATADAASAARAEAAVGAIEEALAPLVESGALRWVHARVSGREQWVVAPHAMDERALRELSNASHALHLLASDQSALALDKAVAAVTATIPERAALEPALLTLEALTPPLPGADDQSLGAVVRDRMLRSEHGRLWFVQVMPTKDFTRFNSIERPLAELRSRLARVQAEHPGVTIGVTGKPVLQEDELATSNLDMARASVISLAIITVLFVWLFRGWLRPLLAVCAFLIAVAITMGLASLTVGRLTLLSSVFLLVLVGAGLDYGVHLVSRFNEYLPGRHRREAAALATREAGAGTLSGAVATSAVFALTLLTEFGGLRELGTLACIGLLVCALVTMTVLPALLTLAGGNNHAPLPPPVTRWWSAIPARPAVVLTALAVVLAAVAAPSSLRFDSNLLSMQAEGLDSVAWEQRILADDATQTWFAASLSPDGPTTAKRREQFSALPSVAKVRSALDLVRVPTPQLAEAREQFVACLAGAISTDAAQSRGDATPDHTISITDRQLAHTADALRRLAALAATAGGDERAARALTELAQRWDALAAADAPGTGSAKASAIITDRAARAGEALRAMHDGASRSLRDALPEAVRAHAIAPDGSWILQIVPSGDAWDEPTLREFVTAARAVDPFVTGVPVTQVESIADMRGAFEQLSWMALLAVFAIAWMDFRRFGTALVAVVAVVAGIIVMLGLLGPLGLSLNLANFFAVPMLLGLGIDSTIHVLHRWERDRRGLPATLTATAFTGVTTAISFGLLVTANHRGLASLGWAMLVGSLACVLVAVVALPAVLHWWTQRARG